MKTMEKEIDMTFENCLLTNAEYQAEVAKLEQLREKRKRLEMGYSFGEYGQAQSVELENQAVMAVLQGDAEKVSDYVTLPPKERTERMIKLLARAILRQEQVVRRMEPDIWREAKKQYEVGFEELYNELIDTAEEFGKALLRLRRLQLQVRDDAGIPEIAWHPKWNISQDFLNRLGLNLDGRGFFAATLQRWKINWRDDTGNTKTGIEA